jgi:uncharacterized protein DUF6283
LKPPIRKRVFDCGDGAHQVLTLENGDSRDRYVHRRVPCEQCPWRSDLPTGCFPASAFRRSANTARDMSSHTFACHMSGAKVLTACAGFLLRGAEHNLAVRMAAASKRFDPATVSDGGFPLYPSYRAMAVANGVPPTDRALRACRGPDEKAHPRRSKAQ